jgi:hypothetical protein
MCRKMPFLDGGKHMVVVHWLGIWRSTARAGSTVGGKPCRFGKVYENARSRVCQQALTSATERQLTSPSCRKQSSYNSPQSDVHAIDLTGRLQTPTCRH